MPDRLSDSDSEEPERGPANEAEWDEWNASEGGDDEATRSLFDDTVLPSVEAAIDHDAKAHGFDVREYRKRVSAAAIAAAIAVPGCLSAVQPRGRSLLGPGGLP
jgi:hypothetical protein